MTCLRPGEITKNTTSIAFLTAGGRLGNAMSTYSTMLALRYFSSDDKSLQPVEITIVTRSKSIIEEEEGGEGEKQEES